MILSKQTRICVITKNFTKSWTASRMPNIQSMRLSSTCSRFYVLTNRAVLRAKCCGPNTRNNMATVTELPILNTVEWFLLVFLPCLVLAQSRRQQRVRPLVDEIDGRGQVWCLTYRCTGPTQENFFFQQACEERIKGQIPNFAQVAQIWFRSNLTASNTPNPTLASDQLSWTRPRTNTASSR